MLWVILQITTQIGWGIMGAAAPDYAISTANGGGFDKNQPSSLYNSPLMDIVEKTTNIRQSSGLVSFGSAVVTTDWGGIFGDVMRMFMFDSPFLTGAWQMVMYIIGALYVGMFISVLFLFISKAL